MRETAVAGVVDYADYHCTDTQKDTHWQVVSSRGDTVTVVADPKSTVQYPNYRRTFFGLNRSEMLSIIFTTFRIPMDNWRL